LGAYGGATAGEELGAAGAGALSICK
jgi:hypothetical protein